MLASMPGWTSTLRPFRLLSPHSFYKLWWTFSAPTSRRLEEHRLVLRESHDHGKLLVTVHNKSFNGVHAEYERWNDSFSSIRERLQQLYCEGNHSIDVCRDLDHGLRINLRLFREM